MLFRCPPGVGRGESSASSGIRLRVSGSLTSSKSPRPTAARTLPRNAAKGSAEASTAATSGSAANQCSLVARPTSKDAGRARDRAAHNKSAEARPARASRGSAGCTLCCPCAASRSRSGSRRSGYRGCAPSRSPASAARPGHFSPDQRHLRPSPSMGAAPPPPSRRRRPQRPATGRPRRGQGSTEMGCCPRCCPSIERSGSLPAGPRCNSFARCTENMACFLCWTLPSSETQPRDAPKS
mmetsp:Transcript_68884/g.204996  ORF Transcript_68884/g.204996 Transcript_68884/m.204996 type:complete len:239 (-) Transcript_68884:177-893(-)